MGEVSSTPIAILPAGEGKIGVRLIHRDEDAYTKLRALPGHRWDGRAKLNLFPASSLDAILRQFPRAVLAPQLRLGQQTRQATDEQRQLVEHIKRLPDAEISGYDWETPPYPHQKVGVAFLLSLDRALLLDEPGLGKTKQAIDTACVRMQRGLIDRCLFIVPNSLKFNTQREILLHAPTAFRNVVVVDGDRKARLAQLERGLAANFTIINYESARLHGNELKMIVDGQMLVCDEAHKIKNRKALITKSVQALAPRYAVLMTGTPVANKVEDLYTLVDFVAPRLLGKNYWEFEDRYLKKGGWSGKEVVGYRNLDSLREKLASVSLRRLKADVLGLPPKTYEERLVGLGKEQAAAYADMRDYLRAKIEGYGDEEFVAKASTVLTQLLRLQQIADGYVSNGEQVRWVGHGKLTELDDLVDTVVRQSGKKLVIWGRFLPVVKTVTERYRDLGAAAIYGEVKPEQRQHLVNAFQDPKGDLRILVGQIQTASLGLTLTATDTEVFYDQSWSPAENLQAEDRLHRMGQQGSVTIVRLLARDTIDERMQRLLETKQRVAAFVAGDADSIAPVTFNKDELLSVL